MSVILGSHYCRSELASEARSLSSSSGLVCSLETCSDAFTLVEEKDRRREETYSFLRYKPPNPACFISH
jgi:hypothetical protein